MDVCKRKGVFGALLGIETYRDPLYGADIIDGTFLVKISKGDLMASLVDVDRCDRCRDLLDQCQMIFKIFFICPVDEVFQC